MDVLEAGVYYPCAFALVVVLHFIGDFICQTHWMAANKSKSIKALTVHVLMYHFVFYVGLYPLTIYLTRNVDTISLSALVLLAVFCNSGLHWLQDYATSRWSAKHFGKDWHTFFVVVGFDQMLHMLIFVAWISYFARHFVGD